MSTTPVLLPLLQPSYIYFPHDEFLSLHTYIYTICNAMFLHFAAELQEYEHMFIVERVAKQALSISNCFQQKRRRLSILRCNCVRANYVVVTIAVIVHGGLQISS
jgi:hypothetical protein